MQHIPSEKQEGEALRCYLEYNDYTFTHISNEIGIRGEIGMLVNKTKKLQGLRKGVPDYMIILKRGSLLFIELKRKRRILKSGKLGKSPSKISPEQIQWIEALSQIDNVEACIAYGVDDAIRIINEVEERK